MVNPVETENAGLQAPDSWGTYQGNNINESWLLHHSTHRKALNLFTWDAVSWIWSSAYLSLQVQNRHFPKEEQKQDKSQHLTHWQRWWTLPERSIWLSRKIVTPLFHKIMEWTLTVGNCYREEANSDSLLELFIWLAFHCFCYCNHTEWFASENLAPLPDC